MNEPNKVIPIRTSNTIDEEAAIWLVKLDNGNLSQEDKNDLRNWLSKDKKHQIALQAMADTWDDMDEMLNFNVSEDSAEKVSLMPVFAPFAKSIFLAASVCCFAIFLWLSTPQNVDTYTYQTSIGQQSDKRLDDGSMIHLNTNSHVEVAYTDDKRVIKLTKGEALFDVMHDPGRPFIVYAGNRLVQAVGTKFVVHLKPKKIEVIVTDGKVKLSQVSADASLNDIRELDSVSINKGDLFVAKGEQAVAELDQAPELVDIHESRLEQELSWLDGRLVFENEKLSDIIREINRYSDINIILNDADLNQLKISGRFELGDSKALIEAIELAFNVTSHPVDSKSVLLTKK